MSATSAFDRFGKHYNISGVAGADGQINLEAYAAYSPLYLPATFAVTYFVAFMGTTAILVHTALYHGKALWAGFRRARVEDDDIHSKLMRTYPEAPDWWYLVVVLLSIGMAIVAIEVRRSHNSSFRSLTDHIAHRFGTPACPFMRSYSPSQCLSSTCSRLDSSLP